MVRIIATRNGDTQTLYVREGNTELLNNRVDTLMSFGWAVIDLQLV